MQGDMLILWLHSNLLRLESRKNIRFDGNAWIITSDADICKNIEVFDVNFVEENVCYSEEEKRSFIKEAYDCLHDLHK